MCECEYCNCQEKDVLELRIYIIGTELYSFCRDCDDTCG
jgi:hypothetical protein